jgi:hypothetical protein
MPITYLQETGEPDQTGRLDNVRSRSRQADHGSEVFAASKSHPCMRPTDRVEGSTGTVRTGPPASRERAKGQRSDPEMPTPCGESADGARCCRIPPNRTVADQATRTRGKPALVQCTDPGTPARMLPLPPPGSLRKRWEAVRRRRRGRGEAGQPISRRACSPRRHGRDGRTPESRRSQGREGLDEPPHGPKPARTHPGPSRSRRGDGGREADIVTGDQAFCRSPTRDARPRGRPCGRTGKPETWAWNKPETGDTGQPLRVARHRRGRRRDRRRTREGTPWAWTNKDRRPETAQRAGNVRGQGDRANDRPGGNKPT